MAVELVPITYQTNANGETASVWALFDGANYVLGSIPFQQVGSLLLPVSQTVPLPVLQPNQNGSLSIPATGHEFIGLSLNSGLSMIGLSFLGIAGGTQIQISVSIDNGSTYQNRATIGGGSVISANGQYFLLIAGVTNIGFQIATSGTGTVALTYSATSAAGVVYIQNGSVVGIDQTTPGVSNAVSTNPGERILIPLDIDTVTTGGTAVTALSAGHRTAGGWILNPETATVNLGINESGTASGTSSAGSTTFIYPGQAYQLAPSANAVSVISSDSAHVFSGQGFQ